ncbi:hypothetical protein [Streptomyces sclerotialus]|uniref:hypothetical protein n=1 Tax=Streptomyces sclerotialus TaxID=1957 RepID=UPI0004C89517
MAVFVVQRYFLWVRGSTTASVTIGLDPDRRYLVTGALCAKTGAAYGQVYISAVCHVMPDGSVRCTVRDDSDPVTNISTLDAGQRLKSATQVTMKLRGDGGGHRAEGVVYDIT